MFTVPSQISKSSCLGSHPAASETVRIAFGNQKPPMKLEVPTSLTNRINDHCTRNGEFYGSGLRDQKKAGTVPHAKIVAPLDRAFGFERSSGQRPKSASLRQ